MSLGAFLLFGWDKFCASRSMRRVPEKVLLWVAVWGGSPGAILGQQVFRHKTRKEPFRSRLGWIIVGQLALAGAMAVWHLF
ncbi:DUF1294 domain-containing protein [Tropicimonas sp. TH_r6]|uniref:DUF1294 domain-containing protein n=1 Tax=Tropicimonas sp. TH_r6 TaxID=3082085 RepID=UPI002953D4FF|nr:DUF1294 domain-containing protein [Tropicimonas sp. TH_r6]MDV7143652.1 DUF1294 domain-containing protein [Tropicimonas sp. TH_r6]